MKRNKRNINEQKCFELQLRARKRGSVLTFLILLGTFREDILRPRVDAVSVEIVRLEEASPELLLRHVMRHIFIVLLLHCTTKEKNVRN